MECIFCKIARAEIKTELLYEDDDVIAFRDLHPQAPLHVLCIPRQHISTLNDLSPQQTALAGKLLLTAQRVAKNLAVEESGYRLVMNCNGHGGQTVFHIHLHLLAGRQMSWPPG